MHPLKIKRIEQSTDPDDGLRIFIEAMWPKGIKTQSAKIDLWLKDLAPSSFLMEWFEKHPRQWKEFNARYGAELLSKYNLLNLILKEIQRQPVTLIHCARNAKRNHAIALCLQLQFQFLKHVN